MGCSYLVLSDSLGRHQVSPLLLSQRVYCYSPEDQDEITAFLTKGPFVEQSSPQPFQLISIKGTLYLLLPVLRPAEASSWHSPLLLMLLACPARVTLLPLSPGLLPHSLALLSSLLLLLSEQLSRSWEVRLVLSSDVEKKQIFAHLRKQGYMQPESGLATLSAPGLLNAFFEIIRCPKCRRIAKRPNYYNGQLFCYCHPLPESHLPPLPADFSLLQDVSDEVAVSCRCGISGRNLKYDRHLLECASKEWVCVEHRFTGSADQLFEHYLLVHWDELQLALPIILSPD